MLLKTPPLVAAYTVEGFDGASAKELTPEPELYGGGGDPGIELLSRPAFAATQVPPPSVLLKTPPPWVPRYSVEGLVGSTRR
jgi:hypothetical protein